MVAPKELVDLLAEQEWNHGTLKRRHYLETKGRLSLSQEKIRALHDALVDNFWVIKAPSVETKKVLFLFNRRVKKPGDVKRRADRPAYIELDRSSIKIMDGGEFVGEIVEALRNRNKITGKIKTVEQ